MISLKKSVLGTSIACAALIATSFTAPTTSPVCAAALPVTPVSSSPSLSSLSSLQASSLNRPEYQQYQRDDFSETSLSSRILPFRRDLD